MRKHARLTVKSYIQFFKSSLFRILPFTINFPQFEAILSHFLFQRAASPVAALHNPPPACTISWFGLLFGILACGAQLGSDEESELTKARVFGECYPAVSCAEISIHSNRAEMHIACCSFQCLRLNNFISFPDIHTIQSLILLVNFLQNQANAGASWSMLGKQSSRISS